MWWFKIRKSVRRFAEMMEMRLRMYDAEKGKQGWLSPNERTQPNLYGTRMAHPAWLMSCMDEELVELHNKWDERHTPNYSHMWRKEVIAEALDVANYAMMLVDVMVVRGSYECAGGSVDTS
jgi:hypothetical protein